MQATMELQMPMDLMLTVVINMSAVPQTVKFDQTAQGLNANATKTLMTTQSSLKAGTSVGNLSLEPFAVYIAAVKP